MRRSLSYVLLLTCAAALAGTAVDDLQRRLQRTPEPGRAAVLNLISDACLDENPEQALVAARQALSLAERFRLEADAIDARLQAGNALLRLGRTEEARAEFARARGLAQKAASDSRLAAALHGLGNIAFLVGRYPEARACYQQALQIRERLGDRKGMARTLNNLGNIACHLRDDASGEAYYRRALALNRQLGDREGQSLALNNLGLVEGGRGHLDRALDYYLQALKIEEERGNLRGQGMVTSNVAILYRDLGNLPEAQRYVERCLAIYRRLGDKRGVSGVLNTQGSILLQRKEYPKAIACFRESLLLKQGLDDRKGEAVAYGNLGNAFQLMGDLPAALGHFRKTLAISEALDLPGETISAMKSIADIHIQHGEFREAEAYLKRALQRMGNWPERDLIRDIHLSLSDLYAAMGRWKGAYEEHRAYSRSQDVIVNREAAEKVAELQTRFETEKKAKEIDLLSKNNRLLQQDLEIQRLRLSRQRLQIYTALCAFALVLAILLRLFKKYLYLLAFWKKRNYIGPYRLVDQIGTGGMGVVFRAAPVTDGGPPVAIKVLREEYAADPVLRKRFCNEARLIDQLRHPHIVEVYERGEHNQRLYIAMELIDGRSLAEMIAGGERLTIRDGLAVMGQLAEALACIHEKGVVHRDLKPENIMLVAGEKNGPFVKLLDFDIARDLSLARLTATGEILGTVNYLPPEQISQRLTTAAGDIYSLGVVMYELFTLEKPFWGDAPVDIVRQILETEPVAPRDFCREMPADLNRLILSMLQKDPSRRPDDGTLLAAVRDVRLGVN